RLGTDHRCHTAEDRGRDDPFAQRIGSGEGVGTAAGQSDDRHAVDTEGVRDDAQVVAEREDVLVDVRRRRTDPRTVDPDEADVVPFGEGAGLDGDLAAGTRRAVQPEHRAALGRPELGETEPAALPDRDGAFELGSFDVHGASMARTRTPDQRPSRGTNRRNRDVMRATLDLTTASVRFRPPGDAPVTKMLAPPPPGLAPVPGDNGLPYVGYALKYMRDPVAAYT